MFQKKNVFAGIIIPIAITMFPLVSAFAGGLTPKYSQGTN